MASVGRSNPTAWDVCTTADIYDWLETHAEEATDDGADARALLYELDQLAALGHLYSGMTKLTPHDLWEIRGGSHRVFLQFGKGRAYVGSMCKKLRGRLPTKELKQHTKVVAHYRDDIESGRLQCDEEES